MRCIDHWPAWGHWRRWSGLGLGLLLAGCSTPTQPPPPPPPAGGAATGTVTSPSGAVLPARGSAVVLPAPRTPRDKDELRLQAAQRLVAANPEHSYMGQPPDILLAIPVLEVELHADGRVRQVTVLRYPREAKDTVQLAIAAVHRAAPFGSVERLPKPWKFTETFLFNDERRFKPRTLD